MNIQTGKIFIPVKTFCKSGNLGQTGRKPSLPPSQIKTYLAGALKKEHFVINNVNTL